MRRLAVLAAVILLPLAGQGIQVSGVSAAGTWHVDASIAADPPGCDSTQTYKTIAPVLACAASGDTINLATGTYPGGFTVSRDLTFNGATSPPLPVILGSSGNDAVTVSAGSKVFISGISLTHNYPSTNATGAGIVNFGTLTLSNSLVTFNNGPTNGYGGIYNDNSATLTVKNSEITHNNGSLTGGLFNRGTATVTGSTFDVNSGGNFGGGLLTDSSGITHLTNSTVTGNSAILGGGLRGLGNTVITNSTISGNTASSAGGGIQSGAALDNTILAGNSAPTGPDCASSVVEDKAGHNLIGNNSGCDTSNLTSGDQIGTPANPIDPKLGSLGSNSGSTPIMPLLTGSPAIGRGDAGVCQNSDVNFVDQRGFDRQAPIRGDCDIGAYDTGHLPVTFYINSSSGSDTLSCSANKSTSPFLTVAHALSCANNDDIISLAGGNPAMDYAGGFTVSTSVRLVGAGVGASNIVGPNGGDAVTVATGNTVTISAVTVKHGSGSSGRGVTNNGTLTITGSTVRDNNVGAGNGGGILNNGTLTVTGSSIAGNSATNGGGLYNGSTATTVNLTLTGDTISGNNATTGGGGGIDDGYGAMALVNTTINGNSSGSSGGGIALVSRSGATMSNSTISGNSAAGGAGGINVGFGATPSLVNTILAGNSASGSGPDCAGAVSDASTAGHNILGNNSSCSGLTNGTNGDQVGTPAAPINPMLGSLAGNGGPTQTMALQPGSPAIGAGDATTCLNTSATGVNDHDQRGNIRHAARRTVCDVGAFDTAPQQPDTWYVDPAGSDAVSCHDNANSSGSRFQSIARALSCATYGDAIILAAGSYAGGFTVSKDLTLTGVGSGATTILGSNSSDVVSVSAGSTVSISGVTLTHNSQSTGNTGAGIVNSGTVTLSNSTVSGNNGPANGYGGIYNDRKATLTVQSSTISNNSGSLTGGLFNRGTATVTRSTFNGNNGGNYGGALFSDMRSSLLLINSTVSGNNAGAGGGLETFGSSAIVNSTISGNGASFGGGLYSYGTAVILSNTIVAGNSASTFSPDCYGSLQDGAGHNLLGNNTGCAGLANGANGDRVGGAPPNTIDPKLDTLGGNGGLTQTMALLTGSPAIGRGDATTCASSGATGVNDLDQRGAPRSSTSRGNCDIGAYDTFRQPVSWYVSPSGSDAVPCSGNSSANPFLTVPTALGCAFRGDTIHLAAGNHAGGFTIGTSVNLNGAGAGSTTILGSNGNNAVNVSPGTHVSVDGVTLTHNSLTSQNTGAGVVNFGGLTLSNSTVSQNVGTCGYGGIYNDTSAALTIRNSTLSQNKSIAGSCAPSWAGGIFNRGSLTITGSTFTANTGGSYAGALYNDTSGILYLTNSTISGNTAVNGGGLDSAGPSTITNSTISDNTAATGGGIATNLGGVVNVANTILAGNHAPTGADCSGSLVDDIGAHNLLGKRDGCTYTPDQTDLVGTADTPVDPKLGPLAGNTGPTQTMALLSGSPAIGKGDATTCLISGLTGVNDQDQRGSARNTASRSACDIGAYDTGGNQLSIQTPAGWNLIGGSPLTVFADATVSWSWNAATGQWTHPNGTESGGTGAWENLPTAGSRTVSVQPCTSSVSLTVVAHRWNMVGNPCGKAVQLPADARAFLWTGTAYSISQTIPGGLAAWVLPAATPLVLTPTS